MASGVSNWPCPELRGLLMRTCATLLVLLSVGCGEDPAPPALPAATTTGAINLEAGPSLAAVDDPTLDETSAGTQTDAWAALVRGVGDAAAGAAAQNMNQLL